MPIARNSFIQMSKLTNAKGRITYISSRAKQENLYAVYETTERKFWSELAKCNQAEFIKSGTEGKCIEARELIIALPESFADYEPDKLLKLFTEHFKQSYDVECISALHHNKRKTNYHIHLIFSERKLLEEPVEKAATRNMFYDETGKHVRTKKEICDENGVIREGCHIIKKGEVYERKLFTIKDAQFKNEGFLDEVKRSYTDLINIYVRDDKQKLKVFERGGVYLATKKIGKNNPKAKQIEADNKQRQAWNETVDRALVSGVPEEQILQIKRTEISEKVKSGIRENGRQPHLFATLIMIAVAALELLIRKILAKTLPKNDITEVFAETVKEAKSEPVKIPERPVRTPLASAYIRLSGVYERLQEQNYAIYQREQRLQNLQSELDNTKGIFKGKQRKELQTEIKAVTGQIESMKRYLSGMVKEYGFDTVKDFMASYQASKKAYGDYQSALAQWEKAYGNNADSRSVRAKLRNYQQQKAEEPRNNTPKKDRGAR